MAKEDRQTNNREKQQALIDRVFEAPIDLVFSMWTNPEYLARWWGPKDNVNPVCEMDARPGGLIKILMRTRDGELIPVSGIFNEVRPPERLVFTTMREDKSGTARMEAVHTVTLKQENGKTRLIMLVEVTKPGPEFVSSCQGMELGWGQSFDRMAAQMVLLIH
jgi:uncharacterized protein YndB with AHSA1/START domain